jgi:hypothetical protein
MQRSSPKVYARRESCQNRSPITSLQLVTFRATILIWLNTIGLLLLRFTLYVFLFTFYAMTHHFFPFPIDSFRKQYIIKS